jgi:hypothetical protein
MKLYVMLLVFLVCLYINYSLTVPVYEGFDVVTDILGGITTGLFILFCVMALFGIVRGAHS